LSPLWPAADQASHPPCLLTVRDTEWEDVGSRNLIWAHCYIVVGQWGIAMSTMQTC
jgi:hypothetical protein